MVIVICSKLSPILHSYLVTSIISVRCSHLILRAVLLQLQLSPYVLGVLNLSRLSDTHIHTCILNTALIAACLAPFSWFLLMNRRS